MRTSLAPYQNRHLMCRGRLLSWSDHTDLGVRQVTIGAPIFKSISPNMVFDELEVLAKEEHVNLFIPFVHLPSYACKFERLELLSFHGVVTKYLRANATSDFGINSIPQSMVEYKFTQLKHQMTQLTAYRDLDAANFIHNIVFPNAVDIYHDINKQSSELPTFTMTKDQLLAGLTRYLRHCQNILVVLSSRRLRRLQQKTSRKKGKGSFLKAVSL